MTLRIASDLTLPLESVTDTIGILAVKGAGKTFTFLVLVEEMVRQGLPVVVFDPIGVCWGLRSSSDGLRIGIPVVVLGGSHGDLPLDPHAGRVLAEFASKERRPIVLDFSDFETKADQIRFAQAFLSRLYEVNREPMHVVLDEADDVAPQKPFGEETRLLRAAEILVRRGRARGIGVTMVTQRPAVLNKNLLTQCGTLIVGRVTSPQDRKAIEAWVDANGTAEQKAELWKSLASLPTTDKWIWSPVGGIFKRVTIRARTTFDSSATPKLGQVRVEPRAMAPVDLEALKASMGAAVEQVKANDPVELKKRIAVLEQELKRLKEWHPVETKTVEISVLKNEDIVRIESAIKQCGDALSNGLDQWSQRAQVVVTELGGLRDELYQHRIQSPRTAPADGVSERALSRETRPVYETRAGDLDRTQSVAPRRDSDSLPTMERSMLIALAQHPSGLTKPQILIHTGYAASGPVSKTFAVLVREGWVADERPLLRITKAGLKKLGSFDPLPLGNELRAFLLNGSKLDKMERAILRVACDAYPNAIGKGQILKVANYAASGPVSKAFARLVRYGYLEQRGKGHVTACRELFG